MENRSLLLPILVVGMSLGTAWAIRGQFGHEHGASWAGSIGALSVLLVSKRKDWLSKAIYATLAGGLGWGMGGMMSYGLLVGYGRADDFLNVFYGLASLFIIGGLDGFLGGGFLGAALSDTKKNPIKWPSLIVEMTVGGILFYFFITEQFGLLLNPPRSEAWTICLGAAVAFAWNMVRNKNYAVLRVAIYSCLGGGLGFAFGNFLQVLGHVSQIHFNFWNVMEYSIGFFGGLGMAYGTLTTAWEADEGETAIPKKQLFHVSMLLFVIPFIMWQQNFEWERIVDTYSKLITSPTDNIYHLVQWGSLLFILLTSAWQVRKFNAYTSLNYSEVKQFFFTHWAVFMILSFIITGAFVSTYRIEQYLYIINYVVILVLISKADPRIEGASFEPKKYLRYGALIIAFIAVLAYIAIQTHGEFKNGKKRFGEDPVVTESTPK